MTKNIRVLIVEDSLSYQELLATIFQSAPDLEVIGRAKDGIEGVNLAEELKPDIITMDIHMPRMDGFEATRQIMANVPCPIVMVSASIDKSQQDLTFEALRAGALSIIDKPSLFAPPDVLNSLIAQVRLMSEVKVVRRWNSNNNRTRQTARLPASSQATRRLPKLVAIAASTGGPGLLAKILASLPANYPAPLLIVQHITPGFGPGLAEWLGQQSQLKVRLAQAGVKPKVGEALIAPDDYHLSLNRLHKVTLNKNAPLHGVRPAADYMFESVAKLYGSKAVGVILTGMGRDGANGLLAMRQAGAHTIAQDQATSVVFGMPAVAIELGAAEQVLPGGRIGNALKRLCGLS